MTYAGDKKKYEQVMRGLAKQHAASLTPKTIPLEIAGNNVELHDTRILVGVLADILMKKKICTKKELQESIASAYRDEIKNIK